MARDSAGTEKLAVVPSDVSIEWVELESGAIVCRDRDTDETYLRFDSAEDYRERKPTDAPATVHYDLEDTNYVVEQNGDVERKYGAKGPLTDDWMHIYEPVIPEAMFLEHGHDSIPEPEAFRIAIVPNDDRDLEGEPELLMFEDDTEEAVPIDAWLDGSTDGVTTESAESESKTEPESEAKPESESDDETDRDDCDDESGESSPDAVPLREPEETAPAPETPEQRPDPERESEAVEDSEEKEERATDDSFNSI